MNLWFFFDTPEAHRINFQRTAAGNGRISVEGGGDTLGSFTFDTTHHLAVSVDLEQQIWSAALDNELIFSRSGNFIYSLGSSLGGVRLNLHDDGVLANEPTAYVDNIRLTAVPEPGTGGLLLLGGLALLTRLRRSRQGVAAATPFGLGRAATRPYRMNWPSPGGAEYAAPTELGRCWR